MRAIQDTGAREAFEQFARQHVGELLRLARLLTLNEQDAEDLTQDALLKVLTKWQRVRSAKDSLAYSRKLLVNTFISAQRRRSFRLVPLMLWEPEGCVERRDIGDVSDSIATALAALPVRQRTALTLRYFLDMSNAQVASWMGIRESSVRALTSRGVTTLQNDSTLEKYGEEARHGHP